MHSKSTICTMSPDSSQMPNHQVVVAISQSLHLHKWTCLPPANLNMSPPLRPMPYTNNSMYLLIANAITSAPSVPILLNVSVSIVNPEISANITTLLMDYFSGNLRDNFYAFRVSRCCTTNDGTYPKKDIALYPYAYPYVNEFNININHITLLSNVPHQIQWTQITHHNSTPDSPVIAS